MANFLLWNVQRKPRADLLARLVPDHALDGLLLVENADEGGEVRAALVAVGLQPVECDPRFGVFVRPPLAAGRLDTVDPTGRAEFFRLRSAD